VQDHRAHKGKAGSSPLEAFGMNIRFGGWAGSAAHSD